MTQRVSRSASWLYYRSQVHARLRHVSTRAAAQQRIGQDFERAIYELRP